MNPKRTAGLLALPLVAVLVVAAVAASGAQAVDRHATRPTALRNAISAAVKLRAEGGAGLAARLRSLQRPDGAAVALGRRALSAPRPTATTARAAETPCGDTPGLLCSEVVVPLDSTGVVPGTISLHVERLPAAGVAKGVMFLIAGGPGQGSAHSFDLGTPGSAALFQIVFPGYTLVAYDDRGTGASGLLRCPSLEGTYSIESEPAAVASCAAALGPNRTFYGTLDHAADLEAVRASLGVDKVGLYGVSYGTKLALAYALVYPTHVERLLLDSVLRIDQPDPFSTNVLTAMPTTLSTFCSTASCQAATPNLAGDVAALANQLEAKPVSGKVLQRNGTTRTARITGDDLLSMIIEADLNPGLAAVMPPVLHEARLGDYRPLLRLFDIESAGAVYAPEDLSSALNAATVCRDGPFPWQQNTALADRPALVKAALAALPPGSFGPFGSWAGSGTADFCLTWPAPSGGVTYGDGTVPNVPVLAISGGFDMRTPTAAATAVASMFPQGRVLVVPGVGHSVVGTDPSFCSIDNVRAWLAGKAVASQCPRGNPYLEVVPRFAPVRSARPARVANTAQTLSLATKTLREAEGMWLMTGGDVAGLYSGRLIATAPRTFSLVRYSIAPGVELTGKVRFVKFGPPLRFDGVVTVGGAGGAHGLLGLSGDKVGGTLDGQIVGR